MHLQCDVGTIFCLVDPFSAEIVCFASIYDLIKIEIWWKPRFGAVLRRFSLPFVRGLCVSSGELCTCNVMYELYFVSLTRLQLKSCVLPPFLTWLNPINAGNHALEAS